MLLAAIAIASAVVSPATAGAAPAVTISDVTVTERTGSSVQATFLISLSEPSLTAVSVDAATAPGTALGSFDFASRSTTAITFAPGELVKPYNVAVAGDALDEFDEQFSVELSNASAGATIGDSQGVGTIADDDAEPEISVTDASVTEADSTYVNAVFNLSLSAVSGKPVTVKLSTLADTANSVDFSPRTDVVISFPPGAKTRQLAVPVRPDTTDEFDETLFLDVTSAESATVATARATGTIVDNDAPPTLAMGDFGVTEGDTTYVNAVSTLSLSQTSAKPIEVRLNTVPGTADSVDFSPRTDVVVAFPPGASTRQLAVPIRPDTTDELDETFFLDVASGTNVATPAPRATGTIVDNDAPPSVSINDVTINEPDGANENATFTLTLSARSAKTINVVANTTASSATTADYSPRSNVAVSFPPGAGSRSVAVPVRSDTMDEYDEDFHLDLTGLENVTATDTRGTATIVDDDEPPTVSISDVAVAEPESGAVNAKATISLSAKSAKPVTVTHDTADGTATDAFDYVPRYGTAITIPAGNTLSSITAQILSDDEREPDEAFARLLSAPVNATIGDGEGTTTIAANCWDREPSFIETALHLGSIPGNLGAGSLIGPPWSAICAGEEDWYRFELREDEPEPCPPEPEDPPCEPPVPADGPTAAIDLDVQDGGLSSNLDVFVYDATASLVGSGENPATMDERVVFQAPATGADDTQYVYVKVVGKPDVDFGPASNDYMLNVSGNVGAPP